MNGEYSKDHHLNFIRHGNNLPCYVVFDLGMFANALISMSEDYYKNPSAKFSVAKVNYDRKTKKVKFSEFEAAQSKMSDVIYRKPARFSYENELRVAFKFHDKNEPIFTKQMPRIPELFSDAVVSFGTIKQNNREV